MRVIPGGPDLPNELVKAHGEGRLVFFCGAGISVPAGLPSFEGLVAKLHKRFGFSADEAARDDWRRDGLDRALLALELTIKPGEMRRAMAEILDTSEVTDAPSHRAIMELSTLPDGAVRLVTTNFDRLFETAVTGITTHSAPALPVPTPGRWNGVVYLHGRIDPQDPRSLDECVLTSADFGRAYLTEAWASRLVTDLFRKYIVLFVGYRADDPVMRYMLDAMASERERSGGFEPTYAFSSDNSEQLLEWEKKGVIPIPYSPANEHELLHHTLGKWSENWRGGLDSRRDIVRRFGHSLPNALDDSELDLLLWALSEDSGVPARDFCYLSPAPPFEWIDVLEKNGLLSQSEDETEPRQILVHAGMFYREPAPTPCTRALGDWVSGRVNLIDALTWVVDNGGQPHQWFRDLLQIRLRKAPEVSVALKRAWELLFAIPEPPNRRPHLEFMPIRDALVAGRWDHALLQITVAMLTPYPVPDSNTFFNFRRRNDPAFADAEPNSVSDLLRLSIRLRCGANGHRVVALVRQHERAREVLASLAGAATDLLSTTMGWFAAAESASSEYDPSIVSHTSIARDCDPNTSPEWDCLIVLAREGFKALLELDPTRALGLAQRWELLRFPVFLRLALFAIHSHPALTSSERLSWYQRNTEHWIWLEAARHESSELLRWFGENLNEEELLALVEHLLEGPTLDGLENDAAEWMTWQRLLVLEDAAPKLPESASVWLAGARARHPDWKGDAGDTQPVKFRESWDRSAAVDVGQWVQQDREAMISWLLPEESEPVGTAVRHNTLLAAGTHAPHRIITLLCALHRSERYETEIWSAGVAGLSKWSNSGTSRAMFLRLLLAVPEDLLREILYDVTSTIERIAADLPSRLRPSFLETWDALAALSLEALPDLGNDAVSTVINDPIGRLTAAALLLAPPSSPDAGLPVDFTERMESLLGKSERVRASAGVILASRLSPLYRVDRDWTTKNVIPLLDWEHPAVAAPVFQGFLWQPRLTPDLADVMSNVIARAFDHVDSLGPWAKGLGPLAVSIMIDLPELSSPSALRHGLDRLDDEQLAEAAEHIRGRLLAAGDKAAVLWQERIEPWINEGWPISREHIGPDTSDALARMIILTQDHFAGAVDLLLNRLGPVPHALVVLDELLEAKHCSNAPSHSLRLLETLVPEDIDATFARLRHCLAEIEGAQSEIAKDPSLRRLKELAARLG